MLVTHPPPVQFANPALHTYWHTPLLHDTLAAFSGLHTCPHAPQLSTSVVMLVTHPPPAQFANPVWQMYWQAPSVHDTPAAFSGLHTCPHAPQLSTSVVMLVTHPPPVQFANPVWQMYWQAPSVHDTLAAFSGLHTCPHTPQLLGSALTLVSQPLARMPSQLANPGLQRAIWQTPSTHEAVAFGNEQTCPHTPQWFGSLDVDTHTVHGTVPEGHCTFVVSSGSAVVTRPATPACAGPPSGTTPRRDSVLANIRATRSIRPVPTAPNRSSSSNRPLSTREPTAV